MTTAYPQKIKLLDLDKPTSSTGYIYSSNPVRRWLENPENKDKIVYGISGELGQDRFRNRELTAADMITTDPENTAIRTHSFEIIDEALYGVAEPYGPKGKIVEQFHDSLSLKFRGLVRTEERDGQLVKDIIFVASFDVCQD